MPHLVFVNGCGKLLHKDEISQHQSGQQPYRSLQRRSFQMTGTRGQESGEELRRVQAAGHTEEMDKITK